MSGQFVCPGLKKAPWEVYSYLPRSVSCVRHGRSYSPDSSCESCTALGED